MMDLSRRKFLGGVAACAVAPAIAPMLPAEAPAAFGLREWARVLDREALKYSAPAGVNADFVVIRECFDVLDGYKRQWIEHSDFFESGMIGSRE